MFDLHTHFQETFSGQQGSLILYTGLYVETLLQQTQLEEDPTVEGVGKNMTWMFKW